MEVRSRARLALGALWAAFAVLSWVFAGSTGLAFADPDAPHGFGYAASLLSSGGNDNIAIEVGLAIGALGLLAALVRLRAPLSRMDGGLAVLLLGVQAVYLGTIDVSSIGVTIIRARSLALSLWLIVYAALWAASVLLIWRSRRT